jgi:hypothetical protein
MTLFYTLSRRIGERRGVGSSWFQLDVTIVFLVIVIVLLHAFFNGIVINAMDLLELIPRQIVSH